MTTNAGRRSVVERIRRENEDEFRRGARAAVQKLLSAGLPHPWMYVYELTQNALDAGAKRVCWRSEGDTVMFQHDGRLALDESHVRGLSSLGASTKGLATVGFMGVGFKSVFARFREASVSDIDWRFRFAVRVRRGSLKSEVPEWFDTLCPHWDDRVPTPDAGYTTAFFFGRPADRQRPVADDLERLASTENRATLAVLALRGLTQVSVDDVAWDLSVDDGIVTVRRSGSDARWRWKAFVSRYRPDDDAMRRFLEVRQETDEHVDEEGRRVEREVVGLLPLDDNGLPQPADHGCVYATLPTQVRIPFGFHLQADWFVNVDRHNLREVTGDAWQEAIAGQIPGIVRQLLIWLSGESDAVRERGYRALCEPDDDGGLLAGPLRNLRDDLARTLADQPIVPVHGPGPRRFCAPEQAAVLPEPFHADFGSSWRPDLLFGPTVMDEHLLGARATDFAIWLEWGNEVKADDVAWRGTLPNWWRALPEDERSDALFALWRGVAENEWHHAPVVPTKAGGWASAHETWWLNEEPPSKREPGGPAVAEALAAFLPSRSRQLQSGIRNRVNKQPSDAGVRWLKEHHKEVKLADLIQQAADQGIELPLVDLLAWALRRGGNRQDLVPAVLTEVGPREPSDALVADPLVRGGRSRRCLFKQPALVADYSAIAAPQSVVAFLERLGVRGDGRLENTRTWVGRYDPARVAALLGVDEPEVELANNDGFLVEDHGFPFAVDRVRLKALQDWLSLEHHALRGKGRLSASSFYSYGRSTQGRAPAQWVRDLQCHDWLLCKDGERRRPEEVLLADDPDREDAPIADIDADLASRLAEEGVDFGSAVPRSPALRRLERRGATEMDDSDLAALLREALEAVGAGEATEDDLRRALATVNLRGVPLASRVVRRTGSGAGPRGNLGGWVVALSEVDSVLAAAVEAIGRLLQIPDTTTGQQALDFLLDVWKRKPTGVEALRDHLAAAYRYVLDGVEAGVLPVGAWADARAQAHLFGHRAWHPIGPTLVVDDVQSTLIRQFLPTERIAVASTHLGDTKAQVRRVVQALDVALLSTEVEVEAGERTTEPPWGSRLRQLTATLSQLDDRLPLNEVTLHDALALRVGGRRHAIQAYVHDGALMLVGAAAAFAVEAAEQLVEHFQLGQRGQEIPRLTGALSALDDHSTFLRHLKLLAEGLGIAPAAPPSKTSDTPMREASTDEETDMGRDPREKALEGDSHGQYKGAMAPTERSDPKGHDTHPGSAHSRRGPVQPSSGVLNGSNTQPGSHHRELGKPAKPSPRGGYSPASSGTRPPTPGRRAADHVRVMVMSHARHDTDADDAASAREGVRDDHTARQAVLHYEKHSGRRAEAMPDLQPGFDVRSIDHAGRERRIEVKGVQGRFEVDASVVLTAQQAREAIQNDEDGVEYWLYVVDSTETKRPRVFPVRWARDRTRLRYGFYAYAWCDAAEHPAEVTAEGLVALSLDAPEPLDPGDLSGNYDQAGNGRLT